jgi:hypothetical protein
MEPKNHWVFFKEIDWECPKNNKFNVDTRESIPYEFHSYGNGHSQLLLLEQKRPCSSLAHS